MKKILLSVCLAVFAFHMFAKELPNGVNVPVTKFEEKDGKIIEAVVAAETEMPTQYGKIIIPANSAVSFYENGSLKTIYPQKILVKTDAGTIVIGAVVSSIERKGVTFYENGKIKDAYIPAVRSKDYPEKTNVVKTPLGNISINQQHLIEFYEDGSVASVVTNNSVKTADGFTLGVATTIKFHKNGKIAEFKPNEQIKISDYIKTRAKTVVTFSEEGKILSFYPDENSFIELGDLAFKFHSGSKIKLYPQGFFKSFVVNIGEKDFSFSGITFSNQTEREIVNTSDFDALYSLSNKEAVWVLFEFYESGRLKSIKTLPGQNVTSVGSEKIDKTFVVQVNDGYYRVDGLEFYDANEFKSISFAPKLREHGEKKNQFYHVGKIVFAPGQKAVARIAYENNIGENARYFGSEDMVIIFSDGTAKIKDSDLTFKSDIEWDENGKAKSYSVLISDPDTNSRRTETRNIK